MYIRNTDNSTTPPGASTAPFRNGIVKVSCVPCVCPGSPRFSSSSSSYYINNRQRFFLWYCCGTGNSVARAVPDVASLEPAATDGRGLVGLDGCEVLSV